jgi:hypothetical protein
MQIRAWSWREAMVELEPEGIALRAPKDAEVTGKSVRNTADGAASADCRKLGAKKQCGNFFVAF